MVISPFLLLLASCPVWADTMVLRDLDPHSDSSCSQGHIYLSSAFSLPLTYDRSVTLQGVNQNNNTIILLKACTKPEVFK